MTHALVTMLCASSPWMECVPLPGVIPDGKFPHVYISGDFDRCSFSASLDKWVCKIPIVIDSTKQENKWQQRKLKL